MVAIFIIAAFAVGLITNAELHVLEDREYRETHCIKNKRIRVCEDKTHTKCGRHCDDQDL